MIIDQGYVDIQKNSLEFSYPAYIKRRLLTKLSEKSLIINNKRMSNGGNNLLLPDVSYIEDVSEKVNHLFRTMNIQSLISNIEDLEFRKEYRHMVWFKLNNLNIADIMERIATDATRSFLVYNGSFVSDSVNEEQPSITVKQVSSVLYLKFNYILNPRDGDTTKKIKFVVLARIDLESEMLEICFDKIKFDYRTSENFYSELIDEVLERLKTLLNLQIEPIDFKALIYFIKENKDDVNIIAMKLKRNGTVAHLDSFENEEFIIPILGELKNLIDSNNALFNTNQECRNIKGLLSDFIEDIEVTSDLPNVKLRWINELISLGADHNYHDRDYTLFMLYDELSTERRRIDYVREYFVQCITEFSEQIQSEPLPDQTNSADS